ncbi:hypothetical protein [Pseudofrankia inefficax]|uniref:Uncharacterized protein n=1 Tax=Pseudofrankia inefficax (strain DSM 45817 / CECT 9037 / DDB 130130 / EuI1c) TaxID=298654 RepID=E3J8J4_PSEI1|nr:hypothetical protein [Pseudofrankia inefficax]ADP84528.1 hypothetical protein FraEuI1c_6552 [Pseudofrankia inefficax]
MLVAVLREHGRRQDQVKQEAKEKAERFGLDSKVLWADDGLVLSRDSRAGSQLVRAFPLVCGVGYGQTASLFDLRPGDLGGSAVENQECSCDQR